MRKTQQSRPMGVMRCVPGDNLAKLKSVLFTLLLPGMNRKSKTAYYRLLC